MTEPKIRVLIVDDSALMRQRVTKILEEHPRIVVIGTARDGKEGVQKALELKPDVITMDIHMPKMDGITSLQYIMELVPCPVIILSSYSNRGAAVTFEALELGAFDYVTKPDQSNASELQKMAVRLIERVLAAGSQDLSKKLKRQGALPASSGAASADLNFHKVVMIGASTGGPKTVQDILRHIPENFPAPMFLVQHMPPVFTTSFAERLNRIMPIRVVEADNRMIVEPGTLYVAPGGRHMYVEKAVGKNHLRIALRSHPEDSLFKPCIDVSMDSLLEHVPGPQIVSVLLTGMGSDGAQGMVHVRSQGGVTIAESEETAIVYGMPKAAAERGGAQFIVPSYRIGEMLVSEVMGNGY